MRTFLVIFSYFRILIVSPELLDSVSFFFFSIFKFSYFPTSCRSPEVLREVLRFTYFYSVHKY